MIIKKLPKGKKSPYDQSLKNRVCFELLSGRLSLTEAKATYGIKGQGTIYNWIKDYKKQFPQLNLASMNTAEDKPASPTDNADDLAKKNRELQEALEMAKLKITALETMIDVAETELHIDIRKKSGTKQ
jgi:transposase